MQTSTTPQITAEIPAAPETVMHLLEDHVPLALLCDLTAPDGPASEEILAEEGAPDDQWWVQ